MASNKTFMRADKELLKEIEACKLVKGESYADVVKRLIQENRLNKKKYFNASTRKVFYE